MSESASAKMNPPSTVDLDLRGLKCPLPALRTARALEALPAGARLHVEATDPMAAIDIPHLVATRGDLLVQQDRRAGALVFVIERVAT